MAGKPYAHYKLILGGPISGAGTWSIGLTCTAAAAATQSAIQDWLNGIAGDVNTTFKDGTAGWGSYASGLVQFTSMRGYHYAAGASSADLVAEYFYGSPQSGSGSGTQPLYTAIVASLRTVAAGPHNRGRVYVPALGASITGGLLANAQCDVIGTGIRDLVNRVNGSTLGGEDVNVVVGAQLPAPPAVSSIRVDNKPDTMRSRDDKLVANHTFVDDV